MNAEGAPWAYENEEAAPMNNRIWFQPWRWIYAPVSAAGWLAVVLMLLFCANTFLAIDRHSHSVSDTLC